MTKYCLWASSLGIGTEGAMSYRIGGFCPSVIMSVHHSPPKPDLRVLFPGLHGLKPGNRSSFQALRGLLIGFKSFHMILKGLSGQDSGALG